MEFPPFFSKKCILCYLDHFFIFLTTRWARVNFPTFGNSLIITLINKSRNKSDAKTYRTISFLSTISKIFESIITIFFYIWLLQYLKFSTIWFFVRQICWTELIILIFLYDTLEKGLQVYSVYSNFSKVFDKVTHHILFHKISLYCISGMSLQWLGGKGSYILGGYGRHFYSQ